MQRCFLLIFKTQQLSSLGWRSSVPLLDLCIVPCALWFLWGQVSPPFPHWDSCLSVQVLSCLLLSALGSRALSYWFLSQLFLSMLVVDVVEMKLTIVLGSWTLSNKLRQGWAATTSIDSATSKLMLAIFPFFRWVKCQPHAGSHVQRICSCFPLLLLFHCRVLQANSIWRGYFLLPEKCLILLPCFLSFPVSLILISQIQSLWEIRQYEIWKLLG